MLKQKVIRLNIELSETKTNYKTEIDDVKKESKKEIKAWRKELGEERRKNIKIEQELKDTLDNAFKEEKPLSVATECSMPSNPQEEGVECTVWAEPIEKQEPEYFNGLEMNPACDL